MRQTVCVVYETDGMEKREKNDYDDDDEPE